MEPTPERSLIPHRRPWRDGPAPLARRRRRLVGLLGALLFLAAAAFVASRTVNARSDRRLPDSALAPPARL